MKVEKEEGGGGGAGEGVLTDQVTHLQAENTALAKSMLGEWVQSARYRV